MNPNNLATNCLESVIACTTYKTPLHIYSYSPCMYNVMCEAIFLLCIWNNSHQEIQGVNGRFCVYFQHWRHAPRASDKSVFPYNLSMRLLIFLSCALWFHKQKLKFSKTAKVANHFYDSRYDTVYTLRNAENKKFPDLWIICSVRNNKFIKFAYNRKTYSMEIYCYYTN